MNKKSQSVDFIYGWHAVTAVIKYQHHRSKKLFIARTEGQEALLKQCEENQIPWEFVDRHWLMRRFNVGSEAQGLVLQCAPFIYQELDTILPKSETLLVLDSWQDSVNLGRASRSAVCFGVDAIVICKDRSAQINAAAEKAAVGALAQLPVVRVVNLSQALKKIKEASFFVYGADALGETSVRQCDFAKRAALVIGQEGFGLRELTKRNCDVLVNIPMAHEGICLNAADAALLFAYEISSRKLSLFRS